VVRDLKGEERISVNPFLPKNPLRKKYIFTFKKNEHHKRWGLPVLFFFFPFQLAFFLRENNNFESNWFICFQVKSIGFCTFVERIPILFCKRVLNFPEKKLPKSTYWN
jgi:hypothetical protein